MRVRKRGYGGYELRPPTISEWNCEECLLKPKKIPQALE